MNELLRAQAEIEIAALRAQTLSVDAAYTHRERTTCRLCGSRNLQPLADMGRLPLADKFQSDPMNAEQIYPMRVVTCLGCFLVQTIDDVVDEILFGNDYAFFTGASPASLAYFADYAADVQSRYPEQSKGLVVEIASNDGTFLKHFVGTARDILGVEPAHSVALAARENGVPTAQRFFTHAAAIDLAAMHGSASLIIANNVIAHVADPVDFLTGIRRWLAPDGVFVLEFQYLPYLLFNNQFDHFYHEHRSFFALSSFEYVVGEAGLQLVDVEFHQAHGGSLRVFGCLPNAPFAPQQRLHALRWQEVEWGLHESRTYLGFMARVAYIRSRLMATLDGFKQREKRLAGYGASAKSAVLLNYCGIGPDMLEYIEDVTPWKIGKYAPGSHIPIVGPGGRQRPDAYLLLVWNYLHAILARERPYLASGGRFIVPIPTPSIVSLNGSEVG